MKNRTVTSQTLVEGFLQSRQRAGVLGVGGGEGAEVTDVGGGGGEAGPGRRLEEDSVVVEDGGGRAGEHYF